MAGTVTIDRSYFETLLRRAEFQTSDRDLSTPLNLPVVTIPKQDHDLLLQASQDYAALKRALIQGGISPEALTVLVEGDELGHSGVEGGDHDLIETDTNSRFGFSGQLQGLGDADKTSNLKSTKQNILSQLENCKPLSLSTGARWAPAVYGTYQHVAGNEESYLPAQDENSKPLNPNKKKPYSTRQEQRTIRLKNLSDRVEHKDIVDVVRGGQVLDIYFRPTDKTASISFVEAHAAQSFLAHARRNDIYIHGKRAQVGWHDRQFILPGHLAGKIHSGATRNLVIHNIDRSMTEERIRGDLDHIHNLVVIYVNFADGDAFISLNSVHNAFYARTCMMSRTPYKGCKIDYYPDDCAQPILKAQHTPHQEIKKSSQKLNNMTNRFQLLNVDEDEDKEIKEEGSDEEGGGSRAFEDHNITDWAAAVAV